MGSGFNALLGLSRVAAKHAKRSLRDQERRERQWDREEARREKAEKEERQFEKDIKKVEKYEENLQDVLSLHKNVKVSINWEERYKNSLMKKPSLGNIYEELAMQKLECYKPNLFDKIFNRVETKIKRMKDNIVESRVKDVKTFEESMKKYEELKKINELAKMLFELNTESYKPAFKKYYPETELNKYISYVKFFVSNEKSVEIAARIKNNLVPTEKISLLKSGKLSIKPFPKTRYNEIYKEFVFSLVIKIGKEVFGILPIENVNVKLYQNGAPSKSIEDENNPIVIIDFTKNKLSLHKNKLEPVSETISRFNHIANYTKTNGFKKIESKFLNKK